METMSRFPNFWSSDFAKRRMVQKQLWPQTYVNRFHKCVHPKKKWHLHRHNSAWRLLLRKSLHQILHDGASWQAASPARVFHESLPWWEILQRSESVSYGDVHQSNVGFSCYWSALMLQTCVDENVKLDWPCKIADSHQKQWLQRFLVLKKRGVIISEPKYIS